MNIITKIKQFFCHQFNLDKQSKDKYGQADLSNFNKNIKVIEEKDIPVRSCNFISGFLYKDYNPDIYLCSGQLSKEEFNKNIKEYNEKQEKE